MPLIKEKKTRSSYSIKKQKMHNGTYTGDSPFYNNIPAYQYEKPLSMYPNIRELMEKTNFQI